ncbi:MAG: HigA family addiction module antidote protein [Hyphomicrobium sp.]|nr:HigA family addiction module antidote protein [Hyphomicrobium sp.]
MKPSNTTLINILYRSTADDHSAPLHPGEVLREDFLPHCKFTVETLAQKMRVSRPVLQNLLAEQSAISPDMALRLGEAFGMSGRYWHALQLQYDLWQSRAQNADTSRRSVDLGSRRSQAMQSRA